MKKKYTKKKEKPKKKWRYGENNLKEDKEDKNMKNRSKLKNRKNKIKQERKRTNHTLQNINKEDCEGAE